MKITQVHIDSFSGWRDTTIDLPDAEMHVLYGPNETGKSTLLRFVRGVLYGFAERDRFAAGAEEWRATRAGHLNVTHAGHHYVIRRESDLPDGDRVRLTDGQGGAVSNDVLADLLGGVDATTFENVFALGLPELQEIATLSADEVAGHVYHVSLGPTGRRLIDALSEARRRKALLLDDDGSQGTIAALARRIGELDEQIARCEQDTRRHAGLCDELRRLEAELRDQKQRQQGLQGQLRGHEYLERVAGPWRRARDVALELERLPRVACIPDGGLERLDELELQIDDRAQRKQDLAAEARQLAESAARLTADSRLAGHVAAVSALLAGREEFIAAESRLPGLREDAELARLEADEAISRLGDGWNEQRVESVDASPAAAIRLSRHARHYGDLLKRRKREVRRYQHVASRLQQRQADLAQQLKPFQAAEAAEALEMCRRRLALIESAAANEMRARALEQTRDDLAAELTAREERQPLPPYFFAVLLAFGVLGLVLLVAGVVGVVQGASGHTPWLAGLVLTLLGATCGGVTWSVKRHFEPREQQRADLAGRLQRVTTEIAQLQNAIAEHRRAAAAALPDGSHHDHDDGQTEQALADARDRLLTVERLVREEDVVKSRRVSLSRFRERIRETQRTVSAARRDWCRALSELRLDESVRVDAPLEQWREAAEAAAKLDHSRFSDEALRRAERDAAEFRAAVMRLARELGDADAAATDTAGLLMDWEQRLAAWQATRRQRRTLRRDARRRRRAAERTAEKLSELERRRLEHLAAAGAADRDEFEQRVRAHARRLELEEELADSNEALARAAQSEPELAIVEEDLRAFEPAANRAAIDAIRAELSDLAADLEQGRERVGRLSQELQQIESDRRAASLRHDRSQLRCQLAEELQALCAVEIASAALEHARSRLERDHQPRTLLRASDFLSRLTGGGYDRVWTRIAERRLLVDEADGGTLDVEQLSAGTREQLFLAIRLALVDQLRGHGVRLPVVLDDVLVNFDEHRTSAAVRTLCDVAALGQQVLVFTCHQHLVERFRSAGVSTIHLPPRATPAAQRRVG